MEEIILDVFFWAFIVFGVEYLLKKLTPPVVFVVEDSRQDVLLYEEILKAENVKGSYFRNLRGIFKAFSFRTPDAVIVDYFLPDGTGDKLFNKCRSLNIPVLLVTSLDNVAGVDSAYVIKKKSNFAHLEQIKSWLHQVAA